MRKITLTTLLCLSVALISRTATAQETSLLEVAKAHLYSKYPSLQTQANIDWVVTDEVKNSRNNLTHLYLRQSWDGIEITNVNLNFAIFNGKVVSMAGRVLTPEELESKNSKGGLSHEQAIFKSADQLGITYSSSLQRVDNPNRRGATAFRQSELSQELIPVKQVFWLSPKNELKLAYDLSMYPPNQHDWWSIRIDAETGEILERGNWVVKCSFDEPHVHTGTDSNLNHTTATPVVVNGGEQYNVFPMPLESPNHGDRSLVSSPFDPAASPFGWHDTNGVAGAEFTITRGNNVYAYEDAAASNQPGYSPNGGASLIFNSNYIADGNPDNYRDASITNLFYWNNINHDVLYKYGFDEPSGNFQQTNYSGAGQGLDYVLAEDLDGSGTNNANFATPPDGNRPRMQMFLWSSGGSVSLVITSPAGIAGTYSANTGQFGRSLIGSPLSGEFVFVTDGTEFPTRGCSTITNPSEVNGKIAVIERGGCTFIEKVKNAQNAGAIGVLVLSNSDDPINMAGSDPTITIPSLIVTQNIGNAIRSQLAGAQGSLQNNTFFLSGGFDNGIITHEYGHGVSNRLTGGPSNADCLANEEQMGEGWSDYLGLMLTIKEGDTGAASRGIGTYAVGQPITGNGIRPAPYTTNIAINPYTYAGVANEAISRPHGIGFIWCTMLWDMTWLFVERYGLDPDITDGTGGNNMALQLVMDGMKLQPCGPGFIDGRDAILLADQINNGGANQDIIWEAFAARGLGFSASQGSPNNRFDGVVAFDMPTALRVESSVDFTVATVGDEVTHLADVKNILNGTEQNVIIQTTVPEGMTFLEGTQTQGAVFSNGKVELIIPQLLGQASSALSFKGTIDSGLEATNTTFYDDQESGGSKWATQSFAGGNGWTRSSQNAFEGSQSWFVANVGSTQEHVLRMANSFPVSESSKLAFWHFFDTEAGFDGGFVEISTDGGTTWTDAGSLMIENDYNDNIPVAESTRAAFAGRSNGYIKTVLNLNSLSGSNAQVRFRFLSDQSVGGVGWRVDNVYVFEGEEIELVAETCVTYDGLANPICVEASSTVFSEGFNCSPFAGRLQTLFSLSFCQTEQTVMNFSVNYGTANINNPGTSYEYAYILTNATAPYTIRSTSANGQFNVEDLEQGQYKVWGLSYSVSNTLTSVQGYLNDITDLQSIVDDIDAGAICADLTDKLANGNAAIFTKTECVVAGIPLEETSFINYYPNPSNGEITLQIANQVGKSALMNVFTIAGQLVHAQQFEVQSGDYRANVNLKQTKPGVYIIQLQLDSTVYSGRIVIE